MNIVSEFKAAGAPEDGKVPVAISYDIIRQFSAQLYTSPRKAIEELICNSYDAGASTCHVSLPASLKDPLLVLDDGRSMNFSGLQGLWRVAQSPKATGGKADRRANGRMQIGKFGVGKLAAYALGNRLTHVACVNDEVRVISVGQDEIRDSKGGAPTFSVRRLSVAKAKTIVDGVLGSLPRPWDLGWTSWTVAMVEEIDHDAVGDALRIGLLKRMIGTALPVSAKFTVTLGGTEVPRREIDPSEIVLTVDVTDAAFTEPLSAALREFWAESLGEAPEDVPADRILIQLIKLVDPQDETRTLNAIQVPGLGPVAGNAISTKTSLTTDKVADRGYYSNGFAVTAVGKLVNPEDPLFGITQRSHKYWSRFLARVEIPGLDKVLLVQRNAVSENSPEAQVARIVLRTLFNVTRSSVEAKEDEPEYQPPSFGNRLGTSAPILAQAAWAGMAHDVPPGTNLDNITVEFGTFGAAAAAVRFDPATLAIVVNVDHPLLMALDELGEMTGAMRRVVAEMIAGFELGAGLLRARGVDPVLLAELRELIDASLRSAAEFVRDPVEQHIAAIRDASYEGDTPFERAVVEAFRSLRLAAQHLGASDEPDGILEIPVSGAANVRISVEAKGSKGVITHSQLSEATVSRHSGEYACQHAVAVAREFALDGLGGKPSALLRETIGNVPLLTVDAIARLLRLHKRRNFTYDKIVRILTTWTHPDELEQFISDVWSELPEPGLLRLVLTVAHDAIEADDTNQPDPGTLLADKRLRALKVTKSQIRAILDTVLVTTRMITIMDTADYRFVMTAPVETILKAMSASFETDPAEAGKAKPGTPSSLFTKH